MSMTANKTVTAVFDGNCTPNATRCVRTDPGVQERCSADGTWVTEGCDAWRVCAADTCRVACGMTSAPADPTLCLLPIADGVNDGEWWYLLDERVGYGTYAAARTETRFGDYAAIRPAPGEDWPFVWRLGGSDIVVTYFRLDQFGAYRHPALGYRARRAGVQTPSAGGLFVGIYNPTSSIGDCTAPTTLAWSADACTVVTPLNESLDYAGGVNNLVLGPRWPIGGVLDLVDVNYAYLTISP